MIPRWADRARIWPFETGLALPDDARDRLRRGLAVLVAQDIARNYGPPNDKAQVRTVAGIFAERDRAGELARWFAGDPTLTAEQRRTSRPRRPGRSG